MPHFAKSQNSFFQWVYDGDRIRISFSGLVPKTSGWPITLLHYIFVFPMRIELISPDRKSSILNQLDDGNKGPLYQTILFNLIFIVVIPRLELDSRVFQTRASSGVLLNYHGLGVM